MAKAIFTTKVSPTYDDLPEQRYHFPRTYLGQAKQAVGDWIIYYEPRRSSGDVMSGGGRQSYFATARVDRINPDPVRPDHFYAEVSNYLEFVRPVSFAQGTHYHESALRKADGSTNKGAFGRAVRILPDTVTRMFSAERRVLLPRRDDLRPHPQFLDYHRRVVFKG